MQVIDTNGFDDAKGIEYDNKIIMDIYDLYKNCKKYYINEIYLILKIQRNKNTGKSNI